jgi:Uma2 family endonuclease
MAMPAPPPIVPDISRRNWTVEERNALPDDGNRYEVVDGELLVTPAPTWRHQNAALELAVTLKAYAERHGLQCMIAPADVTFSPRRVVEPDVFVVPTVQGRPPSRFEDVGRLVLAVEILSPSTARADRHVKRRVYQSEGIPEYWIVDAANRYIERWRPGEEIPETLTDSIAWQPVREADPLVIDLAEFFCRVHGE